MDNKNYRNQLKALGVTLGGFIILGNLARTFEGMIDRENVNSLEKKVEREITPNRLDSDYEKILRSIHDPLVENSARENSIGNISPQKPVSYTSFRYQDELEDILKHSKRIGVEPEMLMAIRVSENGPSGLEYGILPVGVNKTRYEDDRGYILNGKFFTYKNEKEKQLTWAARTLKKNLDEFDISPLMKTDFISYFASIYAPIGVNNDPHNLNKNWENNFRHFYEKFRNEAYKNE